MNGAINEDRIREIIKEELTNFSPPKKKRAPNKWQVFLKGCVKEQPEELDYMGKVKACSVIYKDNKNERPTNNGNNSQPKSTTNDQEQKSDGQNNSNKGDK